MSYECPYCGAELVCVDSYGRGNLAAQEKYGYGWEYLGDIYKCPNHEGFENEDDAFEYWQEFIFNVHSDWNGFEDGWNPSRWDEIVCESNTHYVSGSFYTDKSGELYEGYPC